jgi:ubiquinone/menaquinone biosynthesis C-methylase UbiE
MTLFLLSVDVRLQGVTSPVEFRDVDATDDPHALIRYLDHIEGSAPMVELRELTYRLLMAALPPRPDTPATGGPRTAGHADAGRGVEVGCGHGRAVADLTALGLDCVGADRSSTMVEAAGRRYPLLQFITADAVDLPFPDRSLAWYRAERVYLHLPDPGAALAEARRVLAPGGVILLADQDMESISVDTAHPEIARTLITSWARALPNGSAGIRARAYLARAGFTDIRVHGHTLLYTDLAEVSAMIGEPATATATANGDLTEQQTQILFQDLGHKAERDHFLAAVTMFLTTARTPAP